MTSDTQFVCPLKMPPEIESTFAVIVTFDRLSQLLKALPPMFVTLLGMTTFPRFRQ